MEQQPIQTPPEGHAGVESILRHVLTVDRAELDRREADWKEQKAATKKKSKPSAAVRAAL